MGHTILLADDSITIQKVIELTFSDEDFQLHTVGNGQKAIDEIHSVKPDIVLCDIIMPERNGYEVCEYIKGNDGLKHIPVLLLTGAFEPFDQERARNAGCDGFLAKPFEPQTLISKVKELLSSAEKAAAAPAPVAQAPEAVLPPSQAAPMPPLGAPGPGPDLEPPTVELSQIPGQATVSEDTPIVYPSLADEGATMMVDNFAVEAGERELLVEPGDQTVLLGGDDTASLPSEDIWREVQQPQEAAPPAKAEVVDEGAATIFMAATEMQSPELEVPSSNTPRATSTSEFAEFAPPTEPSRQPAPPESDAWVFPLPDEEPIAQPAEPELTPLGEFGGFEDFSTPGPAKLAEPEAFMRAPEISAPETPPSFETPISGLPLTPGIEASLEPPVAAPPEPTPFEEPAPPFVPPPEPTPFEEPAPPAAAPPAVPPAVPLEPIPLETMPPLEPIPLRESAPVSEQPPMIEPSFEVTPQTFGEQEPVSMQGEPPFELPAAPQGMSAERESMFAEVSTDEALPVSAAQPDLASMDEDALVERIAERVVAKLSEHVIKEVAWEVVPDLAQTLIQREIDALKAKIPK